MRLMFLHSLYNIIMAINDLTASRLLRSTIYMSLLVAAVAGHLSKGSTIT